MAILIKGMTLPADGDWKTVRIYQDGTCARPNAYGDCSLYNGVKAIPVPPHGRLIDADAFEAHIKNDWEEYDHWIAVEVENRPTVIDAETCNNACNKSDCTCNKMDELDFCRIQERADPIAALDKKPVTNGDRIRAMDDRELAVFLKRIIQSRSVDLAVIVTPGEYVMVSDWLEWLQQEAK